MEELKNKRVIVASHVNYPGPPTWDLEDFLKKRTKSVTVLGFPFLHSPIRAAFFKRYIHGKLVYNYSQKPFIRKEGYLYIRDLLLALFWGFKSGRADIFIGVNNLNTLAGIVLRKMNRVQTVVYYTIDYVPQRFPSALLNKVYHYIDSYCVQQADYVWNLSSVMIDEREKKGVGKKYRKKQITVPIGVNKSALPKNVDDIHSHEIVYMGHLRAGQGVDFLLDAFPKILQHIPEATLAILGGGTLLDELRQKASRMKLSEKVYFSGFVDDPKDLEERLSYAQVAVAPYEDVPENFTRYTDPGKPKAYMALGVPIVITKVPPFALEIDKRRAGIAIEFDQDELVKAIAYLLHDHERWNQYRKNALLFAQEFLWEDIFEKAFRRIQG